MSLKWNISKWKAAKTHNMYAESQNQLMFKL